MNYEVECVIGGCSPYDFEDEKTGRPVKGTSVHYFEDAPEDHHSPVGGMVYRKLTAPYESFAKLKPLFDRYAGQKALLVCELKFVGKNPRLIPFSVKALTVPPLKVKESA